MNEVGIAGRRLGESFGALDAGADACHSSQLESLMLRDL